MHHDILILAAEPSDAENAPDYRVHLFERMSNEEWPGGRRSLETHRRVSRRICRAAD
ncbi:hypothetical protein [Mesorhizobium sp.]|uniref:hypothetical protein n=1 Tax=Mesorhizobium sp. TaxID=1871066 RepID=UPI0025FAD6F6|nr:hypothetical protein [Mesorhizobium sp.]